MACTSERDIGAVIALRNQGLTYRAIEEETGVRTSTAADIIKRESNKTDGEKKKMGRPRVGDDRLKRRIIQQQRMHPKAAVNDILDVVCPEGSGLTRPARRTASEWITDAGIYLGTIGSKSALTSLQMSSRLHWAESNIATQWFDSIDFWGDGVLFKKPVDPALALQAYSFGPNLAKYASGEANSNHVLATKGGHRSQKAKFRQFFWCGYGGPESSQRATLCEPYASPLTAVTFAPLIPMIAQGTRAAFAGSGRLASSRSPWRYSQDGETATNAQELDHLFVQHRLNRIRLPAGSGDLRCIEQWWRRVREKLFREDPGPDEGREAWIARVKRTVLATPHAQLHALTAGMRGRVLECIKKKGARVHY